MAEVRGGIGGKGAGQLFEALEDGEEGWFFGGGLGAGGGGGFQGFEGVQDGLLQRRHAVVGTRK
jgi:hypothetical protein